MSADTWAPEHDEPIDYVLTDRLASLEGTVKRATLRAVEPTREDFDDVLQEARIAAWYKLIAEPDAPAAWVYQVAAQRARNVASGDRSPTGAPRKSFGTGRRVTKRQPPSTPLSQVQEAVDAGYRMPLALTGDDHADAVAEQVDLQRAVATLDHDDRVLVHAKHWLGYTDAETGEALGVSGSVVTSRWQRRILPRLREALA